MKVVVVVYTVQGSIAGELDEEKGGMALKNPVLLAPTPTGVTMVPLTQVSEGDSYVIPESALIFKGVHEAKAIIADKYRELFSGIQVAHSMPGQGLLG